MPYITTDDLAAQALWMAGEPTDGTSDYATQVLDYLQAVYDVLVTGGTFGTRDLATSAGLYSQVVNVAQTDWLWLRKFPPFAFNTTPAFIGSSSTIPLNQGVQGGSMVLTQGAFTVQFNTVNPSWFDGLVQTSVQGGRITIFTQANGVPNPPRTTPRIATHVLGNSFALLDAPWPQETQEVSDFAIWRAEYPVPADFERFCEAWKVQGGNLNGQQPLNVGSYEQVGDYWPVNNTYVGPPTACARMDPATLMMNSFDTFSYRCEGSYVFQPPALELNVTPDPQEPLVPVRFRQVLALGAAMLMMQDKVDSRCEAVASQFREMVSTMSDEYRKEQNSGSELSGRMLYRNRGRLSSIWLRTRSGLPFWP
jgi:hypothetical protein